MIQDSSGTSSVHPLTQFHKFFLECIYSSHKNQTWTFSDVFTCNSQTYVKVSIPFNTGTNGTIAILITNEGVECRADLFEIEVAQQNE